MMTVFMTGSLIRAQISHDSIYIYVFSNWKNAYDKWDYSI